MPSSLYRLNWLQRRLNGLLLTSLAYRPAAPRQVCSSTVRAGAAGRLRRLRSLPAIPISKEMRACLATGLAFVLLVGPACSSKPAPPAAPVLQPPETFDWSGQKISFAMPPAGWRREGETSGGIKGVRFVKERSVGEGIGFGDYYILADRNRSTHIREILEKFDTYDYGFAWDKALREAYAYTDTPFSSLETEIAEPDPGRGRPRKPPLEKTPASLAGPHHPHLQIRGQRRSLRAARGTNESRREAEDGVGPGLGA